ncbi:MAG: hypothetical protein ACTSRP_28435 [Candidatus Helarchaeota archaeon]
MDSKLVEKYKSVLEEVFKDYREAHPEDNIDFEGFIRMITFNLSQEMEISMPRGPKATIYRDDEIICFSEDECYLLKDDYTPNYSRRVCGFPDKKTGKRCRNEAGWKTDHPGYGYCLYHDKFETGKKLWVKLAAKYAEKTTLGKLLEQAEDLEVKLDDVTDEIRFQQGLLLTFLENVMKKPEPEFTKSDIRFLKELTQDMIKSKESAARIKGSMKIDAITVRQFIDQVMSFLVYKLSKMLSKETLRELLAEMVDEVFAPMAAIGMIRGDFKPIQEIPKMWDAEVVNKERQVSEIPAKFEDVKNEQS